MPTKDRDENSVAEPDHDASTRPRATMRLVTLALLTGLGYLGLCGLMFVLQRSLLYFPQPRGAAGVATLTLPVADARLVISARPLASKGALLYFGGNAEDVSRNLEGFAAAMPEHALYLLHYRGFGGSSGSPSEAALFADALALYDRVRLDHREITVVGRSLGSGVAIHLAGRRPVSRLVLVTPFDSIENLAVRQYPFLPVRWLLLDKFESFRYAPQVSAPTLILAAEHDEVVPRVSTEALLSHFRAGIATMQVLAGTDHNSIDQSPAYLPLLMGR